MRFFVYSNGMSKRAILCTVIPLLLAVSCQQQQQQQQQNQETAQEETAAKTPPPLHLGAVHQVYPEQKFALLRIIGPMPGPGDTLITHPADGSTDRIGNLVISTGQPTRNNIIAADIRSGTVVKGDRVFRYRSIARNEESAPEQEEQNETKEVDATTVVDSPYPEPEPPRTAPISNMSNEDFPTPVLRSDEEDESQDTVIETHPAPATAPASAPAQAAPAYLNDIPDDISQWD